MAFWRRTTWQGAAMGMVAGALTVFFWAFSPAFGITIAFAKRAATDQCDQVLDDQLLHCLVTGKGIVVVGGQEYQIGIGLIGVDRHRSRKAAVDRKNRATGEIIKAKLRFSFIENEQLLTLVLAGGAVKQGDLV